MIAPLLEALREKDPATWKRFDGLELATYKQYDDYGTTENYIYQEDLIALVRMAWLQAVLQETIQARGWDFTLSTLKYKNRCIARIDMIDENKTVQYGDSPTEALLAAYIGAL